MGFRITTNMMMNSYKFNLQNSTLKLSTARDQVMTQRAFSSYADDPAAATLSFRLRRDFYQTSNYLANTKDVYSKFNTAWNNLGGVVEDLSDTNARVSSIRGNNGTSGESRTALAVVLRETAESVVQAMNQKYGDHFIFAGNDALNAPFSWKDGKLLYRGIDVNSGSIPKPTAPDPGWMKKLALTKGKLESQKYVEQQPDAKAWYEGVTGQSATLTKANDTIAKMLDDYADRAVNSGAMSRVDADKWLNYYKDPGNTAKPNSPVNKDGEVIEPDWVRQISELSMWDSDPSYQEWYDYDTMASDVEPTSKCPTVDLDLEHLKDATLAERKDAIDNGKEYPLTEAEINAWYDYYTRKEEEPPLKEQSKTVKDWGVDAMKEGDTYPAGLPTSRDGLTGTDLEWYNYYNDKRNVELLDKMASEEMYIDLGMGAAESSPNNPVKGTYFNSALCGVDFLNYGVDKDGDPMSLPMIMRELADVFDNWHENGQKYVPDEYKDMSYTDFQQKMKDDPDFAAEINAFHDEYEAKAFRLMDKLKAAQEHTTEKWVELDAQSVYLKTSESRLTTQKSDLNLQVLDLEQVDLAEAITNLSWQQYCYNSALKIGNQLLSQSLIDYMS